MGLDTLDGQTVSTGGGGPWLFIIRDPMGVRITEIEDGVSHRTRGGQRSRKRVRISEDDVHNSADTPHHEDNPEEQPIVRLRRRNARRWLEHPIIRGRESGVRDGGTNANNEPQTQTDEYNEQSFRENIMSLERRAADIRRNLDRSGYTPDYYPTSRDEIDINDDGFALQRLQYDQMRRNIQARRLRLRMLRTSTGRTGQDGPPETEAAAARVANFNDSDDEEIDGENAYERSRRSRQRIDRADPSSVDPLEEGETVLLERGEDFQAVGASVRQTSGTSSPRTRTTTNETIPSATTTSSSDQARRNRNRQAYVFQHDSDDGAFEYSILEAGEEAQEPADAGPMDPASDEEGDSF